MNKKIIFSLSIFSIIFICAMIIFKFLPNVVSKKESFPKLKCSENEIMELKIKLTAYANNPYTVPEFIINDFCSPQELKDMYQAFQENNKVVEQYKTDRGKKPTNMSDDEWVKKWDEWYQKNSVIPYQYPYVNAFKKFLGIISN